MDTVSARIVDVDGYVHVIDGKIICFPAGLYDLADQKDMDDLLAFAGDLYADDTMRAIHGKDTVCELIPSDGDGARCIFCPRHIDDMPRAVRDAIREVTGLSLAS